MDEDPGMWKDFARQRLKGNVAVTWLNAFKRNCVLTDKLVSNVVVIQNNKAHHCQFRKVNLKLETLVKDGVVAILMDRFSPLFCTICRDAMNFNVNVGIYHITFGTWALGFGEILSANDFYVKELWRHSRNRVFSIGTEIRHLLLMIAGRRTYPQFPFCLNQPMLRSIMRPGVW